MSIFQVCNYESFLCCLPDDLLLHFRCSCFLAHLVLLLVLSLLPNDEEANHSYDQIQICPLQLWEAGNIFCLLFNVFLKYSVGWFWLSYLSLSTSSLISDAEYNNDFHWFHVRLNRDMLGRALLNLLVVHQDSEL